MPYTITHWSKPYLRHTGKNTIEKDTAGAAWRTVDGLVRSDETVEIRSPEGREMGWQELKALADAEAHNA